MITVSFKIPQPVRVEFELPLKPITAAPAVYENSDQSFTTTIDSGDTFTSPDVEMKTDRVGANDLNGDQVARYSDFIPSNQDYEIPFVEAYPDGSFNQAKRRNLKPGQKVYSSEIEVTNSSGTVLASMEPVPVLLPSGDVEFKVVNPELSDVVHTNSYGEPTPLPNGVAMVCETAFPEKTFPCPIHHIDPASLGQGYTSYGAGDLMDLISSGVLDIADTTGFNPVFRRLDPTNVYRLHADTPNPFGTLYRYTLIDGTPPDVDETTWSAGVQVVGKEYFIIDWLYEFGHLQNNFGLVSSWLTALSDVQALNTANHKGFSDWFIMTMNLSMLSFAPNQSENPTLNGVNFGKKGIVSGYNEIWYFLADPDYSSSTLVFTNSVGGDYAKRPNTNGSTTFYISRRVQLSDYESYLP